MPELPSLVLPVKFDMSGLQQGVGAVKSSLQGLGSAFREETQEVEAATKATGRLRDEKGRFRKAGDAAAASARSFGGALGSLKSTLGDIANNLKSFGARMTEVGGILSKAISLPLAALGAAAVKSATDLDSLKRGLVAVAGSSQEAERQLVRLREVAKLPGLGFKEAIQGSVRLQAAGFTAELAERSLKAFGNAIATVGGGKEQLDGVTLALGQIASKGKISAEEINQLNERVPQIRQAMKAAFGTADTEALQKAGISATDFVTRVAQELEKLPAVTAGPANAFENLQDIITVSLAKIGDAILPVLIPIMDQLAETITTVADQFAALSPEIQQGIVIFGGLLVALGPVIAAVGAVAAAIGAIGLPVAAAIAAVAALTAAFVFNVGGIRDTAQRVLAPVADFIRDIWGKLISWWQENLPLIRQTVQTVLTAVQEFWRDHGAAIVEVATRVWNMIRETIETVLDVVLGLVRAAMQILNGDWQSGLSTLYEVGKRLLEGLVELFRQAFAGIDTLAELAIDTLIDLGARFLEAGKGLGVAIADGILEGLSNLFPMLRKYFDELRAQLPQMASGIGGTGGADFNKSYYDGAYDGSENEQGDFGGDFGGGFDEAPKPGAGPKAPALPRINVGGGAGKKKKGKKGPDIAGQVRNATEQYTREGREERIRAKYGDEIGGLINEANQVRSELDQYKLLVKGRKDAAELIANAEVAANLKIDRIRKEIDQAHKKREKERLKEASDRIADEIQLDEKRAKQDADLRLEADQSGKKSQSDLEKIMMDAAKGNVPEAAGPIPDRPEATGTMDRARANTKKREAEQQQIADAAKKRWADVTQSMQDVTVRALDTLTNKGFRGFFKSILGGFADLVKQIAVKWATLQLFGGAKSGMKGANGLGGVLGLMPGDQPVGGALGGLGGLIGMIPGIGGLGGLLGGLGGLLGKGGGLGKLFGGVKKLFKFNLGGAMPPEGGFVAERGTGGEFVVPRTPSMAIPSKTMRALANVLGARGGMTIHLHNPRLDSRVGIEQTARHLGLHINRQGRVARPLGAV